MKYFNLPFEIPHTKLSRQIHVILIVAISIVLLFYIKGYEVPFWGIWVLLGLICGQEFFLNTRGNKDYFAAENRYKIYAIHQLIQFVFSTAAFFLVDIFLK